MSDQQIEKADFKGGLDKKVSLDKLMSEPQTFYIAASDEDRQQGAERLGLLAIESLTASGSIKKGGKGIRAKILADLSADIIQPSVVSLEPVPAVVNTQIELELVSEKEAGIRDADELYLDPDAAEYDVLTEDLVPIGEIILQTLAMEMDPYPRAAGETVILDGVQGVSANEPESKRPNPFAILKQPDDKS